MKRKGCKNVKDVEAKKNKRSFVITITPARYVPPNLRPGSVNVKGVAAPSTSTEKYVPPHLRQKYAPPRTRDTQGSENDEDVEANDTDKCNGMNTILMVFEWIPTFCYRELIEVSKTCINSQKFAKIQKFTQTVLLIFLNFCKFCELIKQNILVKIRKIHMIHQNRKKVACLVLSLLCGFFTVCGYKKTTSRE